MNFPASKLKERRVETGLSRKDLYKKLRIPVSFIAAIEENELEQLPSMTYSIGFLRSYCEFLGFEPEPFVDALEDATRRPRNLLSLARPENSAQRPAWFNELIMWAAIASIVILGWVAYTVVLQPTPDRGGTSVHADTLDLRPVDATISR